MALELFNTLTRTQETIRPLQDNHIRFYSCGPTVYNFAHIGNFRAYICIDVLKRYLKYKGFKVTHVMNLTDVDDKTIKGSQQEKISLKEFTTRYEKAFFEDLETLNIDKADHFPRATDTIPEMVVIVEKLMEKGIAYKTEDGIYYDIAKFEEYGKLSHAKLEKLEEGKRVKKDEYDKEHVQDFALWKFWDKDDGDVFWDVSIGKGRPGWHLECSAMSMKLLGESFDIHAGGIDLVFPHHENEIAQSEGCTGKEFAKYWFHNEHLLVNGKKMSKSLGNFFTLRDMLQKGHDPKAIRYLLLSAHYRQQLNFTQEGIAGAKNAIERLHDTLLKLKNIKNEGDENTGIKKMIEDAKKEFEKEMDDDLNISKGLGVIFDFTTKVNTLIMENALSKADASHLLSAFMDFDRILGVLETSEEIPEEIKQLVAAREDARKHKDFKKSDMLRAEIKAKGYLVEDSKSGIIVKKG